MEAVVARAFEDGAVVGREDGEIDDVGVAAALGGEGAGGVGGEVGRENV